MPSSAQAVPIALLAAGCPRTGFAMQLQHVLLFASFQALQTIYTDRLHIGSCITLGSYTDFEI